MSALPITPPQSPTPFLPLAKSTRACVPLPLTMHERIAYADSFAALFGYDQSEAVSKEHDAFWYRDEMGDGTLLSCARDVRMMTEEVCYRHRAHPHDNLAIMGRPFYSDQYMANMVHMDDRRWEDVIRASDLIVGDPEPKPVRAAMNKRHRLALLFMVGLVLAGVVCSARSVVEKVQKMDDGCPWWLLKPYCSVEVMNGDAR